MSRLIDELQAEHRVLIKLFSKVEKDGLTLDEMRKEIFKCKSKLLAHLKKEDEFLYPALDKAAENNLPLKVTLDLFAKDNKELIKMVLDFFEKYESTSLPKSFAKDLGDLLLTVSKRIHSEENIIYKKFNEFN